MDNFRILARERLVPLLREIENNQDQKFSEIDRVYYSNILLLVSEVAIKSYPELIFPFWVVLSRLVDIAAHHPLFPTKDYANQGLRMLEKMINPTLHRDTLVVYQDPNSYQKKALRQDALEFFSKHFVSEVRTSPATILNDWLYNKSRKEELDHFYNSSYFRLDDWNGFRNWPSMAFLYSNKIPVHSDPRRRFTEFLFTFAKYILSESHAHPKALETFAAIFKEIKKKTATVENTNGHVRISYFFEKKDTKHFQ